MISGRPAGGRRPNTALGEISSNIYRASVRDIIFFLKASFSENYFMVLKIYANLHT